MGTSNNTKIFAQLFAVTKIYRVGRKKFTEPVTSVRDVPGLRHGLCELFYCQGCKNLIFRGSHEQVIVGQVINDGVLL